ncbi:response regulator transcription factor [Aquamicrobium sp. LC103]|uniref:response regulator n=1 Tax=Aquamicrobium sp. LC103 TaxID=1120658 RepID=UPI00069C4E86|nr:response regulator transcription factor [Aquamicrobium sp. LC103]TKT69886.1 response regulator transcription factor [Aquamicrobium sp. LC103]
MTDLPGRVLIVDDHPVVLYGLRFLFEQDARYIICGEAADSLSAREQAEMLQPDFVILDLVLGGRDGIELLQDLTAIVPSARILVYSSQNEWRFARRTIQAGAKGYVAKSEGLAVVGRALDVIAAGETFISEAVRQRLVDAFETNVVDPRQTSIDQLSNRELQVLRMIGEGSSSRDIANALKLSIKTVGTYCERIKVKLQLESLRDLEELARDHVLGRHPR